MSLRVTVYVKAKSETLVKYAIMLAVDVAPSLQYYRAPGPREPGMMTIREAHKEAKLFKLLPGVQAHATQLDGERWAVRVSLPAQTLELDHRVNSALLRVTFLK